MALLDRFRRPPQWKQDDPLARIAGVEELPLDQQELLIAIAREDGDARVRRAALRKIIDPAAVADVARTDRDEGVRDEATGILRDLALGVFENTSEAESLAALALLTDVHDLITVAESASLESVWRAALGRIDDARALGAVARRASVPAVRLEALSRLEDAAEIAAVAVKSEHKDVAVAAVERISDRETLQMVAAKGAAKAAARRARVLLDNLEPSAGSLPEVPSPDALAARAVRTRRVDLCRQAESLAKALGAWGEISDRLRKVEALWAELAGDPDQDLSARFAGACEAVRARVARLAAEEEERRRLAEVTAAAVAARTALCERLEVAEGEDLPQVIAAARAEWSGLGSMPPVLESQAQALARRFEGAAVGAERRHARALAARALAERAARVCHDAETLAAGAQFPEAVPKWAAAARAWKDVLAAGFAGEDLLARFARAEEQFRGREAAARDEQARNRQANLERLQRQCARVETVLANPALALKDAERCLHELRAALDDMPMLPQKQDHDDMVRRLKALHGALLPKVQELREIDEWQRWANAGIQEQLCTRAEALATVADTAEVARQLRELQEEWKKASLVPREKAQALWARFRAATEQVRSRCDTYFAQQAEERRAHVARKEALCQQAEALADSTDWIKTAEAIKALQAEWKRVGPAPRGVEQALWDRFRHACDRFFTRRHEDLANRKKEWAANLEKKLALCARVEALSASTDWEQGISEIKRAQAEWKTVGPVRRNRADAVWERFRGACDAFFESYRERDNARLAAERIEREELCAGLEGLAPAPAEAGAETAPAAADDLVDRVLRIRERWLELERGEPSPAGVWAALNERFGTALDRVVEAFRDHFNHTPLDLDAMRRAMTEICEGVEGLLAKVRPAQISATTPAAVLAQQLREALAANTIGGRAAAIEMEAKWRAVDEELRDLRARWRALGPVPGEAARALSRRFEQACHRLAQQRERQLRSFAQPTFAAAPRGGAPYDRRQR